MVVRGTPTYTLGRVRCGGYVTPPLWSYVTPVCMECSSVYCVIVGGAIQEADCGHFLVFYDTCHVCSARGSQGLSHGYYIGGVLVVPTSRCLEVCLSSIKIDVYCHIIKCQLGGE